MQQMIAGQILDRVIICDANGVPLGGSAFGGFDVQTVEGVTTGGSAIPIVNTDTNRTLWLKSATNIAAKEITLPSVLSPGKFIYVGCDHNITTLTFTAGPSVLGAPVGVSANGVIKLQKVDANLFICVD